MNRGSRATMTRNYLLALGVIAALSITAFFLLLAIIRTQETSAALVNVSGRQRMLSQRTALFSLRLVLADKTERQKARRDLLQAVNLMEKSADRGF